MERTLDDQTLGAFGKRFIERRDVFAEQHANGSYTPVRRPIKLGDLRDHVTGKHSYGHYLVSTEGRCRLFAFDIDAAKEPVDWGDLGEFVPREAILNKNHAAYPVLIAQLNALAEGLARKTHRTLGIPVAAAFSGRKGLHVYGFTGPDNAETIREAGESVLKSFGVFEPSRGKNFWRHTTGYEAFEIEVFPKQVEVGKDGFGNLMRLPLGIHAVTKQKSHFVHFSGSPTQIKALPAHEAIEGGTAWFNE